MENSSVAHNRRSRRSNVLLTATLEADGATIPVKLRNLSAEGALVEAENLPPEGSQLLFRRKDICEIGRVVWVNGNHAGIAFKDKLPTEQVLRHVPTPRPKMKPDFRRPGLAARQLSPEELRLADSWVWARAPGAPGE